MIWPRTTGRTHPPPALPIGVGALPGLRLKPLRLHLLLLSPLLLLGRHVVSNRAAACRTKNAMMRHMAGDAADNGTLDAALGLGRARRNRGEGKYNGRR
jgi:hypothetical protein